MSAPLEIPLREVHRRLNEDNPWWTAGQGIEADVRSWPRRAYFAPFMRLLREVDVARAIVLVGPRRVGKTVLLRQAVQSLLDAGEAGNTILYVAVDTPLYSGRSFESLVRAFVDLHQHPRGQRLWVFFDEVQYLKDWQTHLKSLVDSHRSVRFVASGSAAAALRMQSRESGAGRFTEFVLPPLTFQEYLQFARQEAALISDEIIEGGAAPTYRTSNILALNDEFLRYLNYGGFPEAVVNEAVRATPARFLRQDIIDKVLLKDLPSLFGIGDTQELNRFFNVLAYGTGGEVSPEALSKHSGIAKKRLLDYLEYLEAAFLVKRVHRVDGSAQRLQRARSFKVYLTNPSVRAALFGLLREDDEAIGSVAETAVWSQWLHSSAAVRELMYARWKVGRTDCEVDLVGVDTRRQKPAFVVEIKWSDRAVDDWSELRGLREFARMHKLARRPLVTTLTRTARGRQEGLEIDFVPTSLHCYTIARNLLRA